jgi:hypothetical protein
MKFTATRGESWRANELTIQTRQAGTCTVVDVAGRMTIDSSRHLRPVLHGAIPAAPPAGVTTRAVVKVTVFVIVADLAATALFYAMGWSAAG